jgi:hypothetical protein
MCWADPSAHMALELLPQCWAHPYAPVALGLRWERAMSVPHLGTSSTWVMALDPRFLNLKILNIIICFRNIFIFIIINIINKIINNFERK